MANACRSGIAVLLLALGARDAAAVVAEVRVAAPLAGESVASGAARSAAVVSRGASLVAVRALPLPSASAPAWRLPAAAAAMDGPRPASPVPTIGAPVPAVAPSVLESAPRLTRNWTEAQARAHAQGLLDAFAPDFKERGIEPMLMLDWDGKEPDARVNFDGMFHNVHLSRGFLRTRGLTGDGLTLALLHEIGHMLGDGPRLKYQNTTTEGEADYFCGGAGLCRAVAAGIVDPAARPKRGREWREADAKAVALGYREPAERRFVARVLAAALNLRRVLRGKEPRARLNARDRSVVAETSMHYPSNQARLDTMVAGFLGESRPRSWAVPEDFVVGSQLKREEGQ